MLEQAGMILSVSFIVIIIMGALGGLIKGMRKSLFQLVFSMFFLILAVIMIPFIAEALLDLNISFLKEFFPQEFQEHVTTIREIIPHLLRDIFSENPEYHILFTPGSETLEIIYGVVKLVLVVALFIVYFILSITILKLITLICWQFAKPKEKVNKKRLMGALIGSIRGLLVVLLLAIPLAGISSIYGSVSTVMKTIEGGNSGETVQLESFEENMGAYGDLLTLYDDTWVAKIYDTTDLDEKMFDSVFKVDVKIAGKKESVKIRKELKYGVNIAQIVIKAADGEFDENIIFKISDEDIEIIKENLNKTKVLNLVQLVAVEYLYDEIKKENLDKDYETYLTMSNLKSIDLTKDVVTMLSVIQIINKQEFEENIENQLFSFDDATVTEVVDKVAEIQWLEYLLPIGLNFLLNNEEVQELMATYNIDEDTINKPSPEQLIEDFKNIKNVYKTIKDLGINNLEEAKNIFDSENLMALEDEQIENMVDVVFNFELIDSNKGLIAAYIHNTLEQEETLQGLINKEKFIENFDKHEVKYIALLGKILIENDILSDNFDLTLFLTTENIDKISRIMANSKLISEFTPTLLGEIFDSFSSVVLLEVPSDVSYKGTEGEAELKAILNAFKELNELGILDSNLDFENITDEDIADFSNKLSRSITIRHNITAIIRGLLNDLGYTDISLDYERDHWTEEEITNTLMVLKLLKDYKVLETTFNMETLTKDQIENVSKYLSSSNTFRDNITAIINMLITNLGYSDTISINYERNHWTKDEISYTLKSFKLLGEYQILNTGFDIGMLTEDKIDSLSENIALSNTIKDNITSIINQMIINQGYTDINFTYERDHWTKDEISHTLKAFKIIAGDDILIGDNSDKLAHSMSKSVTINSIIKYLLEEAIKDYSFEIEIQVLENEEYAGEAGEIELKALFNAIKTLNNYNILSSTFEMGTLTDEQIEELSTNLSSSKTVKNNITSLINQVITIQGYDDTISVNYEKDHWTETEISYTLKSFKLLNEYQMLDATFDIGTLTDTQIDSLSENFSSSNTVKDNITPIINQIITNQGYTDINFTYERDHWTKDEISHTLKAFKIIAGDDILVGDNSDKLAHSMSSSVTINSITKELLEEAIKSYNYEIEIQVLENEEYAGEAGEIELKALFKAIKTLNNYSILSSTFEIGTLTDEQIEELSTDLSSSKTVKNNITSLINQVITIQGYDDTIFVDYETEHWTETEISYTLKSFKLIDEYQLLEDTFNIATLSDTQIGNLSKNFSLSNTVKDNITTIISKVINNHGYSDTISVDYEREHWTETEISSTLKSLQLLDKYQMLDANFEIGTLTDTQIDLLSENFSSSNTVKDNITTIISKVINNQGYNDTICVEYGRDHWTKDEISHTLKSLQLLDEYQILEATFDIGTLTDNQIEKLSEEFALSNTVKDNITPIINKLIKNQGYTNLTIEEYDRDHWTSYEIYHTLRAFRIIAGEDILLGDNSDKLAHSMSRSVAINSITKELLEEAIKDYSYEIEIQVLENEEYAGEAGEIELKALFKAMKTLNEHNILSSTFTFDSLNTDEKIRTLSTDLTSSKTIKRNINGIINHLVAGKDYNFISTDEYDEEHWTEDEVYYTISAFKVFDNNNITSENIHTLTDEQIANVSKSKTITGGFKNEVYRMNENTPENTSLLKGKLVIPEGLIWYSTETTKGETLAICSSVKV
ncbi:MAG: CvpA family protein [Acholeplasmataceae bacterium]|nr:CvpA family protein [Acholeplasmataceae bacterium]